MAVLEPVTPLAIRTKSPAPTAPLDVTTIVTARPAEAMDQLRKTLTALPVGVITIATALPAEVMDPIHKTLLTAPPVDVTTILTALPEEAMDPIHKTLLTARPVGVTTILMALPAEVTDPVHKTLTAPPVDVVMMAGVRQVLMGVLRRLHMVGIVALDVVNTITNHRLIFAAPGKILPPTVVTNNHFPTGAPAVVRG